MKFLSRLNPFNKIAKLEENIKNLKNQVKDLDKEVSFYKRQNQMNIDTIKRLEQNITTPVKALFYKSRIEKDHLYYVVTQGGFYPIKGSTLRMRTMSEVTRRALMNGFVVYTKEDAETLQNFMRKLTTYNGEDL